MTTLRLDSKAPLAPTSARAQDAARKVDADGNGEVTRAELDAAPREARRELFDALAWDEFRPAIHKFHDVSLARFVADSLTGRRSGERAAFIRMAEVANVVGATCNAGVRLSRHSYSIGDESDRALASGSLIDVD